MVAFGVGEIIGGLFLAQIIDRVGNRAATYANIVMIILQTCITLLYLSIFEYNWLAFAMAFMWGFQDSANNTHTSEMLGFEFDSNTQPYSIDNLVESVGVFVFDIGEAFVKGRKAFLIFNLIVGILGVCFNATTLLF